MYLSPYPADEASATPAFPTSPIFRAQGLAQTTVGETGAMKSSWRASLESGYANPLEKKATLSGDVLGEIWGKVAWINPKDRRNRRAPCRGALRRNSYPVQLVGAMASVAVDLANAVSAVPIAGWIIGIVVGIGRALASLFKGLLSDDSVPTEQRAKLPLGKV